MSPEQHSHDGHDEGARGPEPELLPRERREAIRRTTVRAHVVHEAIRAEGEDELQRTPQALFWSGLAAGLSMGLSMAAEGMLAANLPGAVWADAVAPLGYSAGFVIVVMGRQQLFTENTLTVVLPVLHHRNVQTLKLVARLWAVVLLANLAGAALFALGAETTSVFSPESRQAFLEIGRTAVSGGWWDTFGRGIVAGWLIALMVWLLPTAESARLWIVIFVTYIVGLGHFAHIIAGSVEAFYLVAAGELGIAGYLTDFMVPALMGNVLGGVALVAALNHAQVVSGQEDAQIAEDADPGTGTDGGKRADREQQAS